MTTDTPENTGTTSARIAENCIDRLRDQRQSNPRKTYFRVTAAEADALVARLTPRADPETTAVFDGGGHFTGHTPRGCGEHRTVGIHRAWCFDCGEWCYPRIPCIRCEHPDD